MWDGSGRSRGANRWRHWQIQPSLPQLPALHQALSPGLLCFAVEGVHQNGASQCTGVGEHYKQEGTGRPWSASTVSRCQLCPLLLAHLRRGILVDYEGLRRGRNRSAPGVPGSTAGAHWSAWARRGHPRTHLPGQERAAEASRPGAGGMG